jgi:hypothetical protein
MVPEDRDRESVAMTLMFEGVLKGTTEYRALPWVPQLVRPIVHET